MRSLALLAVSLFFTAPLPGLSQVGTVVEAEALFQSCGDHRLGRGCMFHAGDLSYLASETAQTDPALLGRLKDVAPGTPMQIRGEIAVDFSDTGLLYLRMTDAEPGGTDPHADLRGQLQGDWVYSQDANYGLRVEGTEWHSLFGGQIMGSAVLWVNDGCPATETAGRPGLMIRTEFDLPGEHLCFDLVEFAPDRMVLQQPGDPELAVWTRP